MMESKYSAEDVLRIWETGLKKAVFYIFKAQIQEEPELDANSHHLQDIVLKGQEYDYFSICTVQRGGPHLIDERFRGFRYNPMDFPPLNQVLDEIRSSRSKTMAEIEKKG